VLVKGDDIDGVAARCGIPPIMITPIGHHDRSEATRVVG